MEGKSDISVFMSVLRGGSTTWSKPVQLSSDPNRSEQNPILFPAPNHELWLLHTAQLSGNQDTAIVRRRVSKDNGHTWGDTEHIKDLALGMFVRHPIHVNSDGTWLLPAWDCRITPGSKWDGSLDVSVVYRSSDQGKTWTPHPVPNSLGCVHMSIVASSDGHVLAFFRSRWADFIYRSKSLDGGISWESPQPTTLANNNSSIQALRLKDGRLAIVFNNSSHLDATERRASLYDELDDDSEGQCAQALEGEGAGAAHSNDAKHAASTNVAQQENASTSASTITSTTASTPRKAFWGAPRAPMTLALSSDDGLSWQGLRNLEVGDGYCMSNDSIKGINREYSYPSIRQSADGTLNVAYTVFRKHIRHVRVHPDWIVSAEPVSLVDPS
jgi:predicted neuraminidase